MQINTHNLNNIYSTIAKLEEQPLSDSHPQQTKTATVSGENAPVDTETIDFSAESNFLFQMDIFFSGLNGEKREQALQAALSVAEETGESALKLAVEHFKQAEASRPHVSRIEVNEMDDFALNLQNSGMEVIVKPASINKPSQENIQPIHIEKPYLNPVVQGLVFAEIGHFDLPHNNARNEALKLEQELFETRRGLSDELSGAGLAAVDFTLGLAVGRALERSGSTTELLELQQAYSAARDSIDTWVSSPALASELEQLLEAGMKVQGELQAEFSDNVNYLLNKGGLSVNTQLMLQNLSGNAQDFEKLHQLATSYNNVNNHMPSLGVIQEWAERLGLSTKDLASQYDTLGKEHNHLKQLVEGNIEIPSVGFHIDTEESQAINQYADRLIQLINAKI